MLRTGGDPRHRKTGLHQLRGETRATENGTPMRMKLALPNVRPTARVSSLWGECQSWCLLALPLFPGIRDRQTIFDTN